MSNDKICRAVGIFPNRRDLEKALYELKDSGFLSQQIFASDCCDRNFNNVAEVGFLTNVAKKFADAITYIASELSTEIAILEEKKKAYQKKLKQGNFLIVIEADKDEIIIAERILCDRKIESYQVENSTRSDRSKKGNLNQNKRDRQSILIRQTIVVLPSVSDVAALLEKFQKKSFPLQQIDVIGKEVPRSPPFDGVRVSDRLNLQAIAIPRSSLCLYNARSERGEYLIVVTSSDADTSIVLTLLEKNGIHDWQIYYQQVLDDDTASERLNAIVVENGLTNKNNRG